MESLKDKMYKSAASNIVAEFSLKENSASNIIPHKDPFSIISEVIFPQQTIPQSHLYRILKEKEDSNLIITGPPGSGKTNIVFATALASIFTSKQQMNPILIFPSREAAQSASLHFKSFLEHRYMEWMVKVEAQNLLIPSPNKPTVFFTDIISVHSQYLKPSPYRDQVWGLTPLIAIEDIDSYSTSLLDNAPFIIFRIKRLLNVLKNVPKFIITTSGEYETDSLIEYLFLGDKSMKFSIISTNQSPTTAKTFTLWFPKIKDIRPQQTLDTENKTYNLEHLLKSEEQTLEETLMDAIYWAIERDSNNIGIVSEDFSNLLEEYLSKHNTTNSTILIANSINNLLSKAKENNIVLDAIIFFNTMLSDSSLLYLTSHINTVKNVIIIAKRDPSHWALKIYNTDDIDIVQNVARKIPLKLSHRIAEYHLNLLQNEIPTVSIKAIIKKLNLKQENTPAQRRIHHIFYTLNTNKIPEYNTTSLLNLSSEDYTNEFTILGLEEQNLQSIYQTVSANYASTYLFPKSIIDIGGKRYRVENVDLKNKKVYVKRDTSNILMTTKILNKVVPTLPQEPKIQDNYSLTSLDIDASYYEGVNLVEHLEGIREFRIPYPKPVEQKYTQEFNCEFKDIKAISIKIRCQEEEACSFSLLHTIGHLFKTYIMTKLNYRPQQIGVYINHESKEILLYERYSAYNTNFADVPNNIPQIIDFAFKLISNCPCKTGDFNCTKTIFCENKDYNNIDKQALFNILTPLYPESIQIQAWQTSGLDSSSEQRLLEIHSRILEILSINGILELSPEKRFTVRFMNNQEKETFGNSSYGITIMGENSGYILMNPGGKKDGKHIGIPESHMYLFLAHELAHNWQFYYMHASLEHIYWTNLHYPYNTPFGNIFSEGHAMWISLKIASYFGWEDFLSYLFENFTYQYVVGLRVFTYLEEKYGSAAIFAFMTRGIEFLKDIGINSLEQLLKESSAINYINYFYNLAINKGGLKCFIDNVELLSNPIAISLGISLNYRFDIHEYLDEINQITQKAKGKQQKKKKINLSEAVLTQLQRIAQSPLSNYIGSPGTDEDDEDLVELTDEQEGFRSIFHSYLPNLRRAQEEGETTNFPLKCDKCAYLGDPKHGMEQQCTVIKAIFINGGNILEILRAIYDLDYNQ